MGTKKIQNKCFSKGSTSHIGTPQGEDSSSFTKIYWLDFVPPTVLFMTLSEEF